MTGTRAEVVVVGGGISGLAAAHALRRDGAGLLEVTLLESSGRVGGVLHTSDVAGTPVDAGADAFLARVPEATALTTEVGLADDLVSPATGKAYVWVGGRLRPLPEQTMLGVPSSIGALARSRVLTPVGTARAALDRVLPGRPPGDDVAVGDLVARRLGRQVADRLVDPLLGGVYAGNADRLSLDATVPQLAATARGSRSLIRAARAALPATDAAHAAGPVFRSVRGGLGRLADAVAARVGAEDVRLGTKAALVERVGTAWRVTLVGGRAMVADAVVLATPAPSASKLLRFAAPEVSAALGRVEMASVVIVTLALPAGSLAHAPRGSGFLVPATARRSIKACTFTSQKWGAVPGGLELVRCSLGRAGEEVSDDDDEVLALVRADLRDAVGLVADPIDARVTRWRDALPQYAVGHRAVVAGIEAGVAALPGLALAGASYDGVGIPACIRSGERAATAVLTHLRAVRR